MIKESLASKGTNGKLKLFQCLELKNFHFVKNSKEKWMPSAWGMELLACPFCRKKVLLKKQNLSCVTCGNVGLVEKGVVRFKIKQGDPSIKWYRDKGGTFFHERSHVPYSMSNLDTSVYHHYLSLLRPRDLNAVIVDVGAGDGRNTLPWLAWDFKRIIVADAVGASLYRLRIRLASDHPEWLDRILLIECDVRNLPLRSTSADVVFAIEALYYLNQDYELGLAQCARILKKSGKLLVSERSVEGAAITSLLYGGISEMLKVCQAKEVFDGVAENLVRSRCFEEPELTDILSVHGLKVRESKGISVIALLLGYLRGQNKLSPEDDRQVAQVEKLLMNFGKSLGTRRTHVLVAQKAGRKRLLKA